MKESEYLKQQDLKEGYLYKILARKASYGIWIPKNESFAISRIKFGENFVFEEYHWDYSQGPAHATAKPISEVEKSPFTSKDFVHVNFNRGKEKWIGIKKSKEILEYLNKCEGNRR